MSPRGRPQPKNDGERRTYDDGGSIHIYTSSYKINGLPEILDTGVNTIYERTAPSCEEDCKLLSVTGVLTLDEEDRLIYFCDQCDLHP